MIDAASPFLQRIRLQGNPTANSENQVVFGSARFTMLTPRLIRVEWARDGHFEDRATFAFPTRITADPIKFSTKKHDAHLEIETEFLHLRFNDDGKPFNSSNLSIRLNVGSDSVQWTPGTTNFGNLRGTRRTLDQCAGVASLDEGLLSRDGWSLFDDSNSPVWNQDQTWIEARPDDHVQDWYFFGYGTDYKALLSDYVKFGGDIPLVPRYVLGTWWSRFWAYHADDLKQLVNDFQSHEIPLDVLVVDMDWHLPDGWTGYSWNRQLFPDPEGFLAWVHEQNLFTTFNLHPAEGIQKHEDAYPKFAELLGHDTSAGKGIPFTSTDRAFVQHYFELLHHPMEEQGVDFWWVDWQQGSATDIKNLDPLPWLNHLHFRDSVRRGTRPMLYSRWGGLGNHRYPIGFSGDAYTTWESLAFQPYFTATAANVGYGWWSHDIGGHFGAADPELYLRWVQFGAVSPCLRLHSTKDPLAERRPWAFPEPIAEAAKTAFQFRYRLFPYLYSESWKASQKGLSLCYPMYYEFPESDDAYLARDQYFLGNQLIAAPIVTPTNPETELASVNVWIPDGTWFEFNTGESFVGPRWVKQYGDLNRIPLFAKAGAVVPMAPGIMRTQEFDGSHVILALFPGADGQFELYEDDGLTEAYQRGEYEITRIDLSAGENNVVKIGISGSEGNYAHLPENRTFELHLKGVAKPSWVEVNYHEQRDWSYDAATRTAVVLIKDVSRKQAVEVVVQLEAVTNSEQNTALIFTDVAKVLGRPDMSGSLDNVMNQVLTEIYPQRGEAIARLGGPFAHVVDYGTFEDARQKLGTLVVVPPADGSSFDVDVEWSLIQRGKVQATKMVSAKNCATQQIIDNPFKDEGIFSTFRWSVSVNIGWRGQTIQYQYQSQDAYPSVSQWQTFSYNTDEQKLSLQEVICPDGSLNTKFNWNLETQTRVESVNLHHPQGFVLLKSERQRIINSESLEACAVANLSSEQTQEAILNLQCIGTAKCYLNGIELTPIEPIAHAKLEPMFDSWMPPQQSYYKVSLQTGENQLVVFTRPNYEIDWWGVGATVFDLSGQVLGVD